MRAKQPLQFGIHIFATQDTIRPDELAVALEDRGFESLFLPERTHIPPSRKMPWPGDAEPHRDHSYLYDPFVALSVAAAAEVEACLAGHPAVRQMAVPLPDEMRPVLACTVVWETKKSAAMQSLKTQ